MSQEKPWLEPRPGLRGLEGRALCFVCCGGGAHPCWLRGSWQQSGPGCTWARALGWPKAASELVPPNNP